MHDGLRERVPETWDYFSIFVIVHRSEDRLARSNIEKMLLSLGWYH